MDVAKVAIVGFGTVGSGVARLLLEHGERIARCAGKRLELVQVVDHGPEAAAELRPAAGPA